MLDKLVNLIFGFSYGKSAFQGIYRKLYSLSLRGLNYGNLGFGEENAIKLVKSKLGKKDNIILFDVGANIGEYSEILNDIFENSASIHAFEPSGVTFETLKSNLAKPNIFAHNVGLGSKNETIKLYKQAANSPLASAFQREYNGEVFQDFDLVSIKTLDDFCTENKISHIDFLKIDVEGFEMEVLKGATNMINANKIQFIQFEFGGTQIDPRNFIRDFWQLLHPKYRIYRILKDGLSEIESYTDRLEVFSYSNYLCILKP